MNKVKMLPHYGVVGGEVRPLYFYRAMGREIVDARILSFGACNFACPYCKRDGQFRADDGSIVGTVDTTVEQLFAICDDAVEHNQIVRLSGGDPVVFPEASLAIAEYMRTRHGRKISMAHNGSSPAFASRMAPYLESAAIDLKATREEMNLRAGLVNGVGPRMYDRSVEVQDLLSSSGVLVDIRTPVFGTTTLDDLLCLAADIVKGGRCDCEFWTLRMYKPVRGCDWPAPNRDQVIWMIGEIKKIYSELKIGLRAKWEPDGFLYF